MICVVIIIFLNGSTFFKNIFKIFQNVVQNYLNPEVEASVLGFSGCLPACSGTLGHIALIDIVWYHPELLN